MSFTYSDRTPAAHAAMRADHDIRLTPERVLVSWLAEFGYNRGACSDIRVACRVARAERGAVRWAAELVAHEARLKIRGYVRAQRPQPVSPR